MSPSHIYSGRSTTLTKLDDKISGLLHVRLWGTKLTNACIQTFDTDSRAIDACFCIGCPNWTSDEWYCTIHSQVSYKFLELNCTVIYAHTSELLTIGWNSVEVVIICFTAVTSAALFFEFPSEKSNFFVCCSLQVTSSGEKISTVLLSSRIITDFCVYRLIGYGSIPAYSVHLHWTNQIRPQLTLWPLIKVKSGCPITHKRR